MVFSNVFRESISSMYIIVYSRCVRLMIKHKMLIYIGEFFTCLIEIFHIYYIVQYIFFVSHYEFLIHDNVICDNVS